MLCTKQELTQDEHVMKVARAIYDIDDAIYDFKIAWEDVGSYRRFLYALRAKAAIDKIKEA